MKRRLWTSSDEGTEPSFLQPKWDSPINSPSILVFIIAACLVILATFCALELAEWLIP